MNSDVPALRAPKKPLGRGVCWAIGLLCVAGAACLAVYAYLPLSFTSQDPQHSLTQINLIHPDVARSLPLVWMAGAILLFAAVILLLARRRFVFCILLVIATLLAAVVSIGGRIVGRLGQWGVHSELTASDGAIYSYVELLDVDHDTYRIVRLTSRGLLYDSGALFGTADYSAPVFMWVVRPMPPKPVVFGTLYESPTGLLLGFTEDNFCNLVYDLHNHRYYTQGEVDRLSPFVLLDDKSPIYGPDETAIVAAINRPNMAVLPGTEPLTGALTHRNPAVRQSAANILKALKPKPASTLP